MTPEAIVDFLKKRFEASNAVVTELERGRIPAPQTLKN